MENPGAECYDLHYMRLDLYTSPCLAVNTVKRETLAVVAESWRVSETDRRMSRCEQLNFAS